MALIALGIVGTSIELLFLGHWGSAATTVVWPALLAVAIGLLALVRRPGPRTIAAVRVVAVVVTTLAVVGVWFHVSENLIAGPLDRRFATTWDALSPISQWWLAISGGVGPAPTLAPGVLVQPGLGLLLATLRHPIAPRRSRTA